MAKPTDNTQTVDAPNPDAPDGAPVPTAQDVPSGYETAEGLFSDGGAVDTADSVYGQDTEIADGESSRPESQVDSGAEGQPADAGEADGVASQESDGPEPADLPENMTPEAAYGSAKYFQSKADKLENQLNQMQEEVARYESVQPLVRRIMEDPQLLNTVSQHLNSQGQQVGARMGANGAAQPVQQGQQQQQQALQPPEPPVMPDDFDPYSEDGQKFIREQHEYQRKHAEYLNSMVTQGLNQVVGYTKQIDQQRQEQRQRAEMLQSLQYEHGLSRDEAAQFLDDVQKPDFQNNVQNWVTAWKMRQQQANAQPENGQQQPPSQQQQRPRASRQRSAESVRNAAANRHVTTATSQSGQPEKSADQNSEFFQSQSGRPYVDPVWGEERY